MRRRVKVLPYGSDSALEDQKTNKKQIGHMMIMDYEIYFKILIQRNYTHFEYMKRLMHSVLITLFIFVTSPFDFQEIVVTPDSSTINTVTTYQIEYDRREDNNFAKTNYDTVAITPSDTITVTFPPQYTLTTVTCLAQIDSGATTTQSCSVSSNQVTVTGAFSANAFVQTVTLWVSNILNPSPAITTSQFTGTIGSDVAVPNGFSSIVDLTAAAFASCSVTFNPTTVNSTANMIITLIPQNQIGTTGSIVMTFPQNRWTNDISTTNYLPIASSMSCSNQSANVKSGLLCAGNTVSNEITASSMFLVAVSSQFSFSVDSFLSPPTNEPVDSIEITSYIDGSKIDTCTTYATGLTANTLGTITILTTGGTDLTVNTQYSIRFNFSLVDTLSQADYFEVTFPSDTIMSFDTTTISSNVGILPSAATFVSNLLTLNMNDIGRTFPAGNQVIFTVGTYTAPPSTKETDTITVEILSNGYPKMAGTTTILATESSVSGQVAIAQTTVNAETSYTFTVTTLDPLTSSGKIRIFIPTTVTIAISTTTCANVSGSGMVQFPTCTVNLTENSVTLTSINSTSSIIPIQTMTITISELVNPPSTALTDTFSVKTYYESTDDTLVATGVLDGVNATVATIASANVDLTASSYVVNEGSVTYSVDMTIVNGIPAGGYFYITIPFDVEMDVASAPSHCSININSTSYISTSCTAEIINSTYVVTFTNPFASDAVSGTTFIARISSVFTNPVSTKPTDSFGLYTFHSDGNSIAFIDNSLFVQMNTAASFHSIAITRDINQNYQLATYTFTFSQPSPIQASGIVIIVFPSDVVPSATSACSISAPTSSALSCSLSSLTLTITLPASIIAADTTITIAVTNVRNPPSFAPAGSFTLQTKTSNNLYLYSYGVSSTTLTNDISSAFEAISYEFTPEILNTSVTLKVTFDPSDSTILPSSLWLTLANTFTIGTLSCNSFIDFTGSCTFTAHTVKVTGTFTSASMSFSVSGFTSPLTSPSDYSTVVTFDSNDYKIDQSDNDILFQIACTLPCRTCSPTVTTCTSCYSNTDVSSKIYYDEDLNTCNEICIDGKYEDTSLLKCVDCNSNCKTCQTSATFCQTCDQTSSFKVLYVQSNTTQTCVSSCPSGMYTDDTIDPTSCTDCVSPCATCSDVTVCESCVSGTFLYNSSCLNDCPNDITIENPSNNECDFCDSTCATCTGTTTNCTSCAEDKLVYLNQCLSSCPSPLVPQNGTCGPCDDNCQTCTGDKFTCTSCDTSSSVPYLHNSLCLSTCPQLYYENIGSGVCSLCSSIPSIHCENCSSESTCLSCDAGYVLLNSTCLDAVPDGYVNISNVAEPCTGDCATCSVSVSNCTSCATKNLLNNQCLDTCPSGYVALSKQCEACLSPCKTCETTIDTCTSCQTTLTPDVFLIGNQCLETCPDSTFANTATNQCDSCQSPCEYCTSLTTCTSCLNGFFLEDGACPTTCKTGFTGVNRVCEACQGNCATCENQTTLCTTCVSSTYLYTLDNSCVSDCGDGLFIDALNGVCVSCTGECKTCINSSSTCLSCFTGVLYNNLCEDTCPDKFFNLSGSCSECPNNCSSCTSLTVCTACINNLVLYNDFCITSCPTTHSVIISGECTQCTDTFCHQCTSADVCTSCESDKSLLNGVCLTNCPAGYETNGTHCVDSITITVTSSSSFPVPFSIAAAVFIIACLMSKLQFSHTFMPGAVYALLSLLEWGALGYYLYLYFTQFFSKEPLPLYIGLAALGYLYILNVFAMIAQNIIVCTDKMFKGWNVGCNLCFSIFANIISLVCNHKFRNILFSKLFTFSVFTAQLQTTNKFRVFNVFSFLSLLHSGAAIFSAATAIGNVTQTTSQLYYECIDVMVVTGINVFLAFFNVMKSSDFFYERTTDGFELKKKIVVDDELIEEKISPAGNDEEEEEGYFSKITHVQGENVFASNQGFHKFDPVQRINEESEYSFGSLMDKKYEDISVQALEIINDKTGTKMLDFSQLSPKYEEGSNYTAIFEKSDKNIQNTIENQKTEIGVQRTFQEPSNKSIQMSQKKALVDRSAQGSELYGNEPVDKSVQRTIFYQDDRSMQYAESMASKKPSMKDKNIMYKPQVANVSIEKEFEGEDHSVQMTRKSYQDEGVQRFPSVKSQSLQFQQEKSSKGNQKSMQNEDRSVEMTKKSFVDEGVQRYQSIDSHSIQVQKSVGNQSVQMTKKSYEDESVQIDQRVQYDEVNDQMSPSRTQKVIFEEESNQEQEKMQRKGLIQEAKDELILPPVEVKDYQEELEQRIRDKEKELTQIKRKIQAKQRRNVQKKERRPNFSVQVGKLYTKGSNTQSIEHKSVGKEEGLQEGRQPLKREVRQVEEEVDAQIDKTLEQIQVIDDMDKKRVQYEYQQNKESLKDSNQNEEEEFIDALNEEQQKIVFEDSDEVSDDYHENSFKRNKPRNVEQYRSQSAQISEEKGDGSTKLQSEARHFNKNRHRIQRNVFDVSEIEKSRNDESEQINERPFEGRPYNIRSDMSDTLEEMYPNGNRTIASMKVKNQLIKQKVKQMVPRNDRSGPKNRLPDQKTEKMVNKRSDKNYNEQKKNTSRERQSSLLLAGRSQFTEENLARKKVPKGSPLKTARRWEYEQEERNISQGEEEIPNTRFRNANLILPTETDKEETQFKFSAIKMSERDIGKRGHKVIPKPFDQSRQDHNSSQMSMPPIANVQRIPIKPKVEQFQSEENSGEPYLEDDGDSDYASRYKNNMILDQMLERPGGDDLRHYYKGSQTGRRSQSKNKKSQSHMSNETEKIYMQRLDKKWK